jgi:hypothetical protein
MLLSWHVALSLDFLAFLKVGDDFVLYLLETFISLEYVVGLPAVLGTSSWLPFCLFVCLFVHLFGGTEV